MKIKISKWLNSLRGIIKLIYIVEEKNDCPLRGLAADSNLTVEKLFAMTHDEKEMGE
jgi:hypothetical protein